VVIFVRKKLKLHVNSRGMLFVNLLHARVFDVVTCGNNKDCYPGTCSSNGATCSCPPGFNDSNCNTSRFSCFDVKHSL